MSYHFVGMALGVLIVDDNSLFLDAARGLLEREGMRVVAVASTEADFADLIAESPAAGFLPKSELSADGIRRIVNGRRSGGVPGVRTPTGE